MKNFIRSTAAFCSIVMLFISCSAGKNAVTSQHEESNVYVDNDAPSTCYVQYNDGKIEQFSSLKLVTGVFITPHLLANGETIINADQIVAYQNKDHYAVAAKILTSKKNGRVAKETLPGFAVKIISGKLNVYCRKYYNGANTAEEYFLQYGNDGYIVAYSKDVLKDMLKEDTEALEYFNSQTRVSPKSKKLLTAVQIYNDSQMTAKN